MRRDCRNVMPGGSALPGRRGFTLIEIMAVVVVLAIVGMLVVPEVSNAGRAPRLGVAANILAADLEYAQSESINDPNDLRLIQIDVPNNTYYLARSSTPAAPINRPDDQQPYRNDFASGRNTSLAGVRLLSASATRITFDAYGKPNLTADATIVLIQDNRRMTLTVNAATGDIAIQ